MAVHAPLVAPLRPLAQPLARLLLPYLLAVARMRFSASQERVWRHTRRPTSPPHPLAHPIE